MGERLGKGTDADRPWANRGSTKKENQMAVDKTPKEDLRIRELGWPRKDWKKRKCWRCYRQNRGGWWFQMGSPITWKSGRPPQNVVARFFFADGSVKLYILTHWKMLLFANDACLQDFDCFKVAMGTLRFCPMISMSRVVLSRNGGTMPYADTGLIWTYTKKKFLYIDSRSCIYVRFLKFSSGPWANPSGGGPSWFSVTSASYDMVREWRSLQDLCCLLLSEMFPTRNSCSRQFELAPCSTLPWFGSAAHSNGHKGAMGNPLNPTQPWSPEGEMFCSLASYLIFLHTWPKHA